MLSLSFVVCILRLWLSGRCSVVCMVMLLLCSVMKMLLVVRLRFLV